MRSFICSVYASFFFFFFKQRTSYELRISDWSSDVCSSDLIRLAKLVERGVTTFTYTYDFGDDWRHTIEIEGVFTADPATDYPRFFDGERRAPPEEDRKSVG